MVGAQEELLEAVAKLNEDSAIHGILVQLPLPAQCDEALILKAIAVHKDADGFSVRHTHRDRETERQRDRETERAVPRVRAGMGSRRPGFMSPTNSSVAKSPRKTYPKQAWTANGATLVTHDRWPAAASTTQPAVKSTQKPMLKKHATRKNEQTSYAEMQRSKQE